MFVEATIALAVTSAGRRGPIHHGSRPAIWFGETAANGEQELHSVLLDLGDGERLRPGEDAPVRMLPLAYETWPDVKPGTRFEVYDGTRAIGVGRLTSTPASSSVERELRRGLTDVFEEWLVERFGERLARRPRSGERLEPDFIARFEDDANERQVLIGEVVGRRPSRRDVDRLARMMDRYPASLGMIVALDEPSAATLDAIYGQGTVGMSSGGRVPRIRVVTSRDLARDTIDLLPAKRQPREVELLAA